MDRPKPPGMVISGLLSGSGKTAITCMILAALAKRGIPVQPFKAGPDFIDPIYHRHMSDVPSVNLDLWLMGSDGVNQAVDEHIGGRFGVLEGVMGLFDGASAISDRESTNHLARLLDWPIVMVLPAAKAGRSLAVSLRGVTEEAGANRIAGVILNQVSGSSHTEYLREAIAPLGIPVLGAIPKLEVLEWPERHLGLHSDPQSFLSSELAQLAEQHLDLAAILDLVSIEGERMETTSQAPTRKIAVAQDKAFHFYYKKNLDELQRCGFEIVPFSPIFDSSLPTDISAILIGGGFPEVHAKDLAENVAMHREIQSAITSGIPLFAECAGLIYLTESISIQNQEYPMCGVIPGDVQFSSGLKHFGYCSAFDDTIHAHEFHHSTWNGESEHANLWKLTKRRKGGARMEGFRAGSLCATYAHLYFPTAKKFLDDVLFQNA